MRGTLSTICITNWTPTVVRSQDRLNHVNLHVWEHCLEILHRYRRQEWNETLFPTDRQWSDPTLGELQLVGGLRMGALLLPWTVHRVMTSWDLSAIVRSVSDFPSEFSGQQDWCAMSVWGSFLVILVFHVFISWGQRDHHSHNIGQMPAVPRNKSPDMEQNRNLHRRILTIYGLVNPREGFSDIAKCIINTNNTSDLSQLILHEILSVDRDED